MSRLARLSHGGSVHGQMTQKCVKKSLFVRVLVTHCGSDESGDSLGVFRVC